MNNFVPSGCEDFDRVRREVMASPTTQENSKYRMLMLYMWVGALQQQCADLRSFFDLDEVVRPPLEEAVAEGDPKANAKMNKWIDDSFACIEKIQKNFTENGPVFTPYTSNLPEQPLEKQREPWPMFQANISNTGHIDAQGATQGEAAWKFPVALGWYGRPHIENNRVYLASPGMRTICFCLDANNGDLIWKTGQLHTYFGIYRYPAIMSSAVSVNNQIVLREVNSHGSNEGQARHLVYLDKKKGKQISKSHAGHMDYRTQYAPMSTNNNYTVYPYGVQDIYATPPVCQNLNRLICANADNTVQKWDINVGDIDVLAEAVLTETTVFQGTTDGYLYALDLETGEMDWKFQTGAPIHTQVVVDNGVVYLTANNGTCYALDEKTGTLLWHNAVEAPMDTVRKQFSTITVHKDTLIFGSTGNTIYSLNKKSGALLWKQEASDWVRSRAVVIEDKIYVATLDGLLTCLTLQGNVVWQKQASTHPILTDLVAYNNQLYLSDGNLRFYCLDTEGNPIWQCTTLESFTQEDGTLIYSDTLSGGTYYQSKPTAADNKVYFGTPAGILYANNADTGEVVWKFEMGAAISVGACYYDGKIYAGQQGGERFFYCVDATDGSLVWKKAIPGGWVWGSATVDDGLLYIPTVDGHALCMDAQNGHIVWMYPTAKSIPAEPAVDGNLVYFGSWSQSVYAFDKKTGDIVWKQNGFWLDSGTLIAYKGKIYLPHHDNIFMAMDGKTGEILCEGNLQEEEKGDYSNFNASPCFYKNKAYFSARSGVGLRGVPLYSQLHCVNPENAEIIWTYPEGGGLPAPATSRDYLYVASGSLPLVHCINPETGEPIWIYKMGNRVEEATLGIYGNLVYVLSSDGYLHAIK